MGGYCSLVVGETRAPGGHLHRHGENEAFIFRKMMAFRCWARPKRGKDIWQQHNFRECPCVFIFLVQKNSFIIQVQVIKFLHLYSSQKLFSVMWYQCCSLLHVIYLHAKHYCFFLKETLNKPHAIQSVQRPGHTDMINFTECIFPT